MNIPNIIHIPYSGRPEKYDIVMRNTGAKADIIRDIKILDSNSQEEIEEDMTTIELMDFYPIKGHDVTTAKFRIALILEIFCLIASLQNSAGVA